MSAEKIPFRVTLSRLFYAVSTFAASEAGLRAILMFAGLVALLGGANALNVVNSYVGRNFMTAIADRDKPEFARQALFYLAVFAASTVVAVLARFAEERLGVLWREFLTRKVVTLYLADGAYFRLETSGKLAHPDQRIAEDVRAFTVTTLSFALMALNSGFTVLSFSGVLWSISPFLFIVAVLYAAGGSYFTIVLGRPLIALNSTQLDKEASFRADLIHVREHAESIMVGHHEGVQRSRLMSLLDSLVENFRRVTNVNFRVGLFTTGYNWLIQIIPALIVAPAFMNGTIEFGVITQAAMAFSTLVAAFSLIVTQYQSLSNFATVVGRLSALMETMEELQTTKETAIEIVEEDGRLAYERLTLISPGGDRLLLKDLSLSVPSRARVLVTGPNHDAGIALFKATARCGMPGKGRITRPVDDQVLFLPQRPYLPPGTLRQIFGGGTASDEQLLHLLHALDLERALSLAGDLDTERDWHAMLSSGEQHLLALGRALFAPPQLVFLETVFAPDQTVKILHLLSERSIGYVNIGQSSSPADLADLYDAVLECMDDGVWTWRLLGAGVNAAGGKA